MNFLAAFTRRLLSSKRVWPFARLTQRPPRNNSLIASAILSCRHHSTVFTKLQYPKHKAADEHFIKFTNKLIYALRCMAGREIGLENRDDGYVSVKLLLSHPEFQDITMPALQKIVDSDIKHRFSLKFDPTKKEDCWWIRARKWNEPFYYLKPLRMDVRKPVYHAVYRTTIQEWNGHISKNGIPRLHRDYITFDCGIFTESYLKDMNSIDEVFVVIDVEACMKAGLRFYVPTPPPQPMAKPIHVVTTGDEYGYILPRFFVDSDRVRTQKTVLWGNPDPVMQMAVILPPEEVEKLKDPPTFLRPLDRNLACHVDFPITQGPHPRTIEEAKALLTVP